MNNKYLQLKIPAHINASVNNEERLNIFRDYKEKLEKLFPQIKIIAFDPDFLVQYAYRYNENGNIKETYGKSESWSLYLTHLILKLVGEENKNIEIYE